MGARGGYHRLRTAAAAAAAPSPPGAYRGADSGAAGLAEFGLGDAAQPLGGDASASLLANEYEGTAGFSDGGSGGSYHPRHPGAGNGATPAAAGSGSEEGGAFVLLRNFRLRARDDGWGAVANLDLFFNSIYSYYYHGGLAPIVGSGVVELVSLFFTLWLSVVLFAYVDWRALASCTDEASGQISLYSRNMIKSILSDLQNSNHDQSLWCVDECLLRVQFTIHHSVIIIFVDRQDCIIAFRYNSCAMSD